MSTLQSLVSTAPDSYFEGGFEANVADAKAVNTKTGKVMFKATLTDGAAKAYATSFSQTFDHWAGKRVKFYGRGIKRGPDYQGTAQVTLGDKVSASVIGAGGEETPHTGPSHSPAPQAQPTAPAKSFNEHLTGYATLFQHCYRRAADVAAEYGMTGEDTRQIATAFYIQAVRDGLHHNPPAL